jgi:hypothetical protein
MNHIVLLFNVTTTAATFRFAGEVQHTPASA